MKFIHLALIIGITASTITLAAPSDNFTQTVHKDGYPTYPTVNYGTGAKAEQLKRGEYLVKLGDCIACHTAPNGGKTFAGGYPVETPFGTIYTPNITPDKETGIGNWTQADFDKAVTEGISPQGHYYYPAFPFYFFNILTPQDLKDMKAYLDVIPAVHQENKKSDLSFPFNWRFLQLGWRMMFFTFQKPGPYQPDPKQSALWNRGNYLVNGLGHCGMCHTPSYYLFSKKYPLAVPMRKYDFTGDMVQGFYAPNITSTLLKDTPVQELADVFLKDRLIGGGEVQGPMKEANHDSLKYLTMEDIKAIDTYLVSVKSKTPPVPSHTHKSGLDQGSGTYEKYCAGCHATGAGGAPKVGDSAAWEPRLKLGLNALYKNAINGIGGMPAKGTCMSCTTQDIQYAVNYMVNQSKPGAVGEQTQTTTVKALPKLTMQDGKKIYGTHCAECHAPGTKAPNSPIVGNQQQWAPIIAKGMDVVILNAIQGYGKMAPRGGCTTCTDAEIKAAVKYMVQNSQTGKDYSLW